MMELELNVKGMECVGCENRIKNAVGEMRQVKKVEASHETGCVKVSLKSEIRDELKNQIIEAIEKMDFEVER